MRVADQRRTRLGWPRPSSPSWIDHQNAVAESIRAPRPARRARRASCAVISAMRARMSSKALPSVPISSRLLTTHGLRRSHRRRCGCEAAVKLGQRPRQRARQQPRGRGAEQRAPPRWRASSPRCASVWARSTSASGTSKATLPAGVPRGEARARCRWPTSPTGGAAQPRDGADAGRRRRACAGCRDRAGQTSEEAVVERVRDHDRADDRSAQSHRAALGHSRAAPAQARRRLRRRCSAGRSAPDVGPPVDPRDRRRPDRARGRAQPRCRCVGHASRWCPADWRPGPTSGAAAPDCCRPAPR